MTTELASFYSRTRQARKIIVVDLGFLGDSVQLLPACWVLKHHYPGAELHTLSAPVGREVLALASCVDRAWSFPLGSPSPPWWRHWNVIRALRRERFHVAFNFSGADRTIFLTALTGAPWRMAHARGRRHSWNSWLIRDWVPPQSQDQPVYEQRRQVLAACGLHPGAVEFGLQVPAEAQQWAQTVVPAGAVHFSINASSWMKEWPVSHWATLAGQLLGAQPHLRLVASGSSHQREQARLAALAAAVRNERLVLLPAGLSVAQLAAALTRCRLHVGADSGVLHLAMALGVSTLVLTRQYPGLAAWLPVGEAHRHLVVPCDCVGQRKPACATAGEAECLARISPAEAERVVVDLLSLGGQ